ncbi:hypothetical protein HPP92_022781 [Vanilla planifolia]|uniref:Bidirectional sugar transporter SWEET n=1 Tax=Vanilla planifolia TaxID=51239 RepID=A0A835UFR1_VANPL|nr:hypothetical protein HPP92_022781 [Vanilla planifolia]
MVAEHSVAVAVGIVGNVISFMVYLAPVPTFYRVCKKKSTEGFHSLPYVVALFSAMLWIYYALTKTSAYLLITINSLGCFIETMYILIYLLNAHRKARVETIRVLVLLNIVVFGGIVASTRLLCHGTNRKVILGWICVGFSVGVFIAPLGIVRQVVRTKSVEFMPFSLSFFLTVSAAVWLCYGVLSKDKFVALPNVLGLVFGVLQMVLYCIYKNAEVKKSAPPVQVIGVPSVVVAVAGTEVHPMSADEKDLDATADAGGGGELVVGVAVTN